MPTAHAIHKFTRFSRPAIESRVERFGLSGDLDPRDILQLKPLEDLEEGNLDLQQERAKEAKASARLKTLQADEKEGRLADVEQLMEKLNELHEGFAQLIKSSDLPDDRKGDILGGIQDFTREWGASFK